jgi:hypothetical protein
VQGHAKKIEHVQNDNINPCRAVEADDKHLEPDHKEDRRPGRERRMAVLQAKF